MLHLSVSDSTSPTYFSEAVDYAVKVYDKYPKVMGILGVSIGILSIIDSFNDMVITKKYVGRVHRAWMAFINEEISQIYLKKRLMEIREDVEALLLRQRTMAGLKLVTAGVFGYFGYVSSSVITKATAAIASSLCGASSVIHAVNYYNLYRLIERLKQDNYMN